jgi:type IV pilus assembly protein PilM
MSITVGLDIGSGAVRAAVIESARSGAILRRFAEMPLPPGMVEGGDVIDEGAVTEAVAALWKRHHLPRKRVVVGIANQRVIVRQVDVPHLEEGELMEALPFQVQDAIPIPVEEAVLDFVPLEEYTTPEGDLMMSILVVAAQREMVEGLVRIATGAGLSVLSIDLRPLGSFGDLRLRPARRIRAPGCSMWAPPCRRWRSCAMGSPASSASSPPLASTSPRP